MVAIDENGVATLTGTIDDPGTLDTFTLDVNWGDALSPNNDESYLFGAGTTSFTLTHQYLDDNPTATAQDSYTIGATVTDDDTGAGSAGTSVAVSNVAPVLTLDPVVAIDEDGVATLTGAIDDPGTLDSFTLDVNWGDALSPNNDESYTFGAGTTSFTLTHQYLDDNPSGTAFDDYIIGLRVTDDDGGVGTESTSVTVNNVTPDVTLEDVRTVIEGPQAGNEDDGDDDGDDDNDNDLSEQTAISGTFTDVGTLDTHTATIDWGDGTVEAAELLQGQRFGLIQRPARLRRRRGLHDWSHRSR